MAADTKPAPTSAPRFRILTNNALCVFDAITGHAYHSTSSFEAEELSAAMNEMSDRCMKAEAELIKCKVAATNHTCAEYKLES